VSIRPATSFFAPRKSKLACTPPGPSNRELGLRQVDLVRGEHELRLRRERVGELEVHRGAAGREVDQRGVREAHVDPAGERGDGRIGALDHARVARRTARCWQARAEPANSHSAILEVARDQRSENGRGQAQAHQGPHQANARRIGHAGPRIATLSRRKHIISENLNAETRLQSVGEAVPAI
jgi:hypothetical protein